MRSPTAAIEDLRTLGWTAPLRVAHELSVRAGGHRWLHPRLQRSGAPVMVVAPYDPPTTREQVPAEAAERLRAEAGQVLEGQIRLFGRRFTLGTDPPWHCDPRDGRRWPEVPFWELSLDGPDVPDPRWIWELGRHRHLVLLARMGWLEPDEPKWFALLEHQLRSWLAANPPGVGVHWASSLELAVRALAWAEILSLVGTRLDRDLRLVIGHSLWSSGRQITAELPRTLSMQRNNHHLGDGVGLVAIARCFPGTRAARWWTRLGDRLVDRWVSDDIQASGQTVEQTVGYHRFVLDLLVQRCRLGWAPPSVATQLGVAAGFLARAGATTPGARPPQWGDWDEGRALATSQEATELAGSVRAALATAGQGAPSVWRAEHDECAWYCVPGRPAPEPAPERDGHAIGTALARAVRGEFTVWLLGSGGTSHAHADLSSVAIAVDDQTVIGDPGTGHYNEDLAERDWFRCSAAHDVVRIDDADQLVPGRQFRWRHRASCHLGRPLEAEGTVVLWAVHDAYLRLEPPRRVARLVLVDVAAVTVVDVVEPAPASAHGNPYAWTLDLPLAPGWEPEPVPDTSAGSVELHGPGGRFVMLSVPSQPQVLSEGPVVGGGWWSPTYGELVPSSRLRLRGTSGDIVWSLALPGTRPPDPRALGLQVRFGPGGVDLQRDGVTRRQVPVGSRGARR